MGASSGRYREFAGGQTKFSFRYVKYAIPTTKDGMATKLTEEQMRKDAAALIEDNREVFDELDD